LWVTLVIYQDCVVVSIMYTTCETPGVKPGLVRTAGNFRGTWCLHNQSSALMSVTLSAV